ncbi:hypothetical protein OC539_16765 [Paracoccus denitrificans]|uniref:Uncharacterized protein n=1 Tax=Paracoccus denitrificans (strain Pd 1222) TaxID=318586 RepID=A1B5D5_PARDP|nr:hypothetical protein [Paracoccus denitrificans]ABL70729.1 hypothetical protein Pden_2642 [Paracoccus denitrificans PD1222]MBB4628897.1 hypothetical protein [Paracoccus denitrificans]MCU7429980.1 hypothetical protein [Paracoccus denitrificans]UPV94965.1 hypothetical protein M0K93_14200 [Paracoccus denitrificans]WQO32981.1 hypothetical protein U0005_11720 [Paracoccus denitrificans]
MSKLLVWRFPPFVDQHADELFQELVGQIVHIFMAASAFTRPRKTVSQKALLKPPDNFRIHAAAVLFGCSLDPIPHPVWEAEHVTVNPCAILIFYHGALRA